MNFKIGRFFYLTISFLLGSFFLVMGLLSLALPWSEFLRTEMVQFILEGSLIIALFGLGFILVGFSLITYTILSTRRRYAYIKTGSKSVIVDESIIQHYLDTYWQEQFPKHHIPTHLQIKKNSIQVKADFPFLPQSQQKDFLEQVKKDFNNIFGNILGYSHEIHLIASFQSKPT